MTNHTASNELFMTNPYLKPCYELSVFFFVQNLYRRFSLSSSSFFFLKKKGKRKKTIVP
jgi:hypothetical protein